MATNNSTNTYIVPTTANEVTMPSQPAFLALMSGSAANVTGNGTVYTIATATEIYDQNADYNNGTYTFTAPVTGRYKIDGNMSFINIAGANTSYIRITSSNRSYFAGSADIGAIKNSSISYFQRISSIADMDAADTATIQVLASGQGADTVGVGWGGSSTTSYSWFSGFLAC